MRITRIRPITLGLLAVGLLGAVAGTLTLRAADVDKRVRTAEAKRVTVIQKVEPAVVAVFSPGGQGGGSGVLIDKEGFALTNFHVVEGSGPVMQCGLPDGVMYDAVLVGLDKVGDVALIKLLPKKEGKPFPFAPLGDSDKVKAGDWSLAMGNPFLLATDFKPTVTFGLVSGVHRYQYPAGTLLEYTDCIQVDTSINPGNSGGPLFNMDGELIGINGRGSFEKRGRVNSGVGYAISINQIKNFLGHLRAGIDTDHATLGARVQTQTDEGQGSIPRLVVTEILESSDAYRRGLQLDSELVSFAGRPMTSVNQFKNVLGLFPRGWRVPLVYRLKNEKHQILVRLMQLQRSEQSDDGSKPKPKPGPVPPRPRPVVRNSKANQLYEPKPGFANYHFNRIERDRLLKAWRHDGDFSATAGNWSFGGTLTIAGKQLPARWVIEEDLPADGKNSTYFLHVESFPRLPIGDDTSSPLRSAVLRADALLRKYARALPQEYWAQADQEQFNKQILDSQKDVATIELEVKDARQRLKKAADDRIKETSPSWLALYDYETAKLTGFLAYIQEYNYMLGQLRQHPPARDPKKHRGWQMSPQEKLQSGSEARTLAREAHKLWDTMARDYQGGVADAARREGRTLLGLKWQPTGGTRTIVKLDLSGIRNGQFQLDPLQVGQDLELLKQPRGSGGVMEALYQWRRLLTMGVAGFEQYADHGGREPFYPPRTDGKPVQSLEDLRVDCEVLRTEHAAVPVKWYFALTDHRLLGFEVQTDPDDDPCEVYLSDYRTEDGRQLPHRMEIRYGNNVFGIFTIDGKYQLGVPR